MHESKIKTKEEEDMSKMKIYTVKDRATDTYGTPMCLLSDGHAIRMFGDEINRAAEENMLYKHPDDYDLYELGTWDPETARYEVHDPTMLTMGRQLKRP